MWVGYPNDRTQMNGLYFGRNVDGGTFPADIWGEYMRQAKGSFCGDFPQPKEPFVSTPFFGEYSSTGGNKLGFATRSDEERAARRTSRGGRRDPEGGTEFDPEQYEAARSRRRRRADTGDGTTTGARPEAAATVPAVRAACEARTDCATEVCSRWRPES